MTSTYLHLMTSRIRETESDLNELKQTAQSRPLDHFEKSAAELLIQRLAGICISIARHRCKNSGQKLPESAADTFRLLAESDPDTQTYSDWNGIIELRNSLIYDSANITPETIHRFISQQNYQPLIRFSLDGLQKLDRA